MRRCIGFNCILAFAVAVALTVPPAEVFAQTLDGQLNVTYTFDRPEITKITIDGVEYDRIVMPTCPVGGDIGEPALPVCGARILLPLGAEVAGVEIGGKPVSLGAGYYVQPQAQPVRLSDGPEAVVPLAPNPAIYELDAPFPSDAFEEVGTYSFRGYQILTLKLCPVVYSPKTGELSYYPRLDVVVNTISTGRISTLFRGLPADEQALLTKVDNPAEAISYPLRAGGADDRSYDLLIVAPNTLAASFQPLKNYHDARGVATEIHTVADMGGSDPATVRDYITDCYMNDGISYVIIGGDDDLLPAPNLWVEAWSGGDIETAMPGDVYFGCLDGTWNYDGDSRWGEPTDGAGGGDVDLVAEVYVGRASGGNATEITRFVNKTIWYLDAGHTQTEKVQLVGEYLGFGGVSDYAAATMEQLIDGGYFDGYSTVGIPSSDFVVDELFERDMSWSQSTLRSRINAGVHFLNHLGHGSENYAMKFYNSDISSLTNTDLCLVYSQTCLAGHFDGTDCWAEYMHIKTDNGAFAVIMNARYGWGTQYSTDGPNQRFNRQFWDAVYGEGKMCLGDANHDSKEDNLYRINDSCARWCYYEINLFGDPTIALRGLASLAFTHPAGLPDSVEPGQETVIEVVVSGAGDGVPVAGSGQLHYSIDGGAYVAVDMEEVYANHYEAVLPALDCGSTIDYYFTAEEATSGTYSDPRGAPGDVYTTFPATAFEVAFEDNFETNQGWTVTGNAADGQWDRGIPAGGGERGDPATDYDGSSRCYLTDNVYGNSDVDDGYTYLISPTIDLSGGDADVSFALWYTNYFGADPNNDLFKIYVSNNNGSNWTLVETVGPNTSNGWVMHEFAVGDFVTPTAQVKVRFEASDLNDGSVVEAGVDQFLVMSFSCEDPDPCPGDLDGDNDVDLSDLAQLLSNYGMMSGAAYEDGDLDSDGDVDLSDLAALLSVYGAPC